MSNLVSDPRLKDLADGVTHILKKSRSKKTLTKYTCYFNKWAKWCTQFEEVVPFPAENCHFALFMISLIQIGESYNIIKSSYYAVKHFHNINTKPDPTNSTLAGYLLEAAKRLCHRPTIKKQPINSDHVHKIFEIITKDGLSLLDLRNFTIIILSYTGFLRYDEVSNLMFGDILLFDTHMKIFIEHSKTDQYQEGAWVYIARLDSPVCPVKTLKRYLELADISCNNEYLFRAMTFFKKTNVHKLRSKNVAICYSTARSAVMIYLSRIGLDEKLFGLHSLRRGGASAAANRGVNDRLFQKHGRWKTAGVKNSYVEEDLDSLLQVSFGLGL